jgi:hypothetical protein
MKRAAAGVGTGETRGGEKRAEKKVVLDLFHRPVDGSCTAYTEDPYLSQHVVIKDDILLDFSGFAVMMPWETPLMVRFCLSAPTDAACAS